MQLRHLARGFRKALEEEKSKNEKGGIDGGERKLGASIEGVDEVSRCGSLLERLPRRETYRGLSTMSP
jgi:hypothetical protein